MFTDERLAIDVDTCSQDCIAHIGTVVTLGEFAESKPCNVRRIGDDRFEFRLGDYPNYSFVAGERYIEN